jgi:ankyrin repeat protein
MCTYQAIHEAARHGSVEVVVYLFQHGGEVGHVTRGGGTALFWARTFECASCVVYLESIGAPDLRDTSEVVEGEGTAADL